MALALPKSKLYEANANSTEVWQADLKKLFHHTRERYPDVVWEVSEDGETDVEEVYGHKAIVYSRAPTSFQAQYFSFRPAPSATPDPYRDSPGPEQSSYSLSLNLPSPTGSLMPDFERGASPSSQRGDGILRLATSHNPALFSNQLEYLYTAQGMGEAFEFLFDAPEQRDYHESEEDRIDKLRKDLCYMWRARLFSDVRIALTGDFRKSDLPAEAEETAVVFFSHRFVLVSRSPYFHKVLQSSFQRPASPVDGSPLTLHLPSTAFTPASLHWALGFMYSGTLSFSHRTFDLDTAFAIYRSAQYLLIVSMRLEVEAYVVEEMLHGLFHAYLTLAEYEKITAGKWGVGGCRCRQCQRRVPRVLEFSQAPDIGNKTLDRGAMRGLVGMFGEGWCTSEFAALSTKTRALVLNGLKKRTTPQNIFPLLFASEAALARLEGINDAWQDSIHDLVSRAQKTIDEVMCDQSDACFEQQEWLEIMDSDGTQFQDLDRVSWIMSSVLRGLSDTNAPRVYQTLVSSVLLRPNPSDASTTILPTNSPVRARVEETRMEIIRWLRKHWMNVKLAGGFDSLQTWSLTEIGHELEISVPDLRSTPNGRATRTTLHAKVPKEKVDPDTEGPSVTTTSMRANLLNRNMAKSSTRDSQKDNPIHSVTLTRKSLSTQQRDSTTEEDRQSLAISTSSFSSARSLLYPEVSSPTASTPTTPKLLGATFGRSGTIHSVTSTSDNHNQPSEISHAEPPARAVPARRTIVNSTTSATDSPAAGRPKSIAASVKSTTSTIRRGGTSPVTPVTPSSTNANNNTIKGKPEPRKSNTTGSLAASSTTGKATRTSRASSLSRPSSRVSDVSGSFKSAKSELEVPPVPRNRTVSMASTTSTQSIATDAGSIKGGKSRGALTVSTPKALRPRKTSDTSVVSTASLSNPRGNITPKRPSSQASVRSTVSSRAGTTTKRVTATKPAEKPNEPPKRVPRVSATNPPSVRSLKQSTSSIPTPKTPKTPKAEAKLEDELPVTPPVIVQVEEHEAPPSLPPPVPEKEARRDTMESVGSSLAPISPKDKRPSATSTMSTTSSSTIRITKKRSNDTITELSEKDVSTLRAKALAKLTGTPSAGSPSRPSAADVVAPSPMPISAIPASPTPSRPSNNDKRDLAASPITPPTAVPINPIPPSFYSPEHTAPQGITLNIGIPCIITSRRARFRAFARYLGEVIGERGPWIGVEVPLGEFAANDKLEGRDWHDGSWNGIRYFEIQNAGWDDDEKAKRRRMGPYGFGRKREAESSLSVDQRSYRLRSASPAISDVSTYESRGLFIRPQQVLYVIDARAEY
ncbi:hypothetical protein FRB91_006288 [Serendipita sp. 411]|nr:hypothetical protein FRB91_006288 [Serendipita sp. 411]